MPDRGEAYELFVKEALRQKIQAQYPDIPITVHHNQLFPGTSGHEHQIDLALELDVAGARILVLVECKHYGRRVGNAEVLAFSGRIRDIGAHKGIIVTPVGFQPGAWSVAEANGIALVLLDLDRPTSWDMLLRSIVPPLIFPTPKNDGDEQGHTVGRNRSGVAEQLCKEPRTTVRRNSKDDLEYIWIPPGEFLMGAPPDDERAEEVERPQHPVRITRGFWLGKKPVTVAAYKRFVKETNGDMPDGPFFDPSWSKEDGSVVMVTWHEAVAFCKWAGGNLPTEAQWEYVARAGRTGLKYPWGNDATAFDSVGGRKLPNEYPPSVWGQLPVPLGVDPVSASVPI